MFCKKNIHPIIDIIFLWVLIWAVLPPQAFCDTKLKENILGYEKVEHYVMDNGMTVILKPTVSPLTAIQVWVRTGSINEGELMGSGVSHYVEHMLFKGTKKRQVGEIARQIRRLGGRLNAFTSLEQTVYHLVLPAQYLEQGLDISADAIQNSSFLPDECEREKQVILKEINMGQDDPDRYLTKLFYNTMYTKHPYRHPIIGYRSVFSALTREDLLGYYKRQYVPSNMALVVVGGIDLADAKALIEKYWADFTRRAAAPLVVPEEPNQIQPKRIEKEFPLEVSRLLLGFQTINIGDDDLYALDVVSMILGKGRSSRLYRRLKEEAGIVYKISCYSYTPAYRGLFAVSAGFDYEKLPEIEKMIWEELDRLKKEEVDLTELTKIKNQVISELLFDQESVEEQAHDLGMNEFLTGNYKFSARYMQGISQVTPEQLMLAARKYFAPDQQLTVILKPPSKEKGKQAEPAITTHTEIKKFVLDNGLTLLINENHQLPIVNLHVAVKCGVRS